MDTKKPFHKDLEKSFELERAFEALRKEANPSLYFRMRLSAKLFLKEFSIYVSSFFYSLTPKRMVTQKIISGLVGLFVLAGGSTSVYAYTSEGVVNGDALYGLKLAIEQVEGNFQFSEKAKALYHLKLAERRLEESKHLALEGKEDSETEAQMQVEVAASKNAAAEIPEDKARDKAFSEIQSRLNARVEVLKSLLADIEDDDDVDDEGAVGTSAENQFGQQGAEKSLKHANKKAKLEEKLEAKLEKKIEHLERLLSKLEAKLKDVNESLMEDEEDVDVDEEDVDVDEEDVDEEDVDEEETPVQAKVKIEAAAEVKEDAIKEADKAAEEEVSKEVKEVDKAPSVTPIESSSKATNEFTLESLRLAIPDDMEAKMTTEMLMRMVENLNAASPEVRASMLANMMEQWKLMQAQNSHDL